MFYTYLLKSRKNKKWYTGCTDVQMKRFLISNGMNFSFKIFGCFIPLKAARPKGPSGAQVPLEASSRKRLPRKCGPLTGQARARLLTGFILLFFVFSFFAIDFVYASYPKIAPGDTVTLGEFVFDDDFVATTTACTVGITDPLNVVKVASTTPMTANNDGWHYYNYTTAGNAPSGVWPSVMICGSVQRGDLVIVDKSFIVDWSVVSTSTIKDIVDDSYTVTLSDFGGTTVNTAYKAKLQVLNYATIPTDADSLPTVVITDSAGTVQVPAGVMTKDSNGTYSYSYSIGGSAVGGVWETVVSVVLKGQTVKRNDYWNLSSSPADVNITEITDKIIPTITANVRIDNKGTSGSDFYYVYCIVSSVNNLCGGNDDTDSGSATAFINAGSFINLSLTLDEVPTARTYWFKVKARALAETNWAAATEQFTAESGTVTPPVSPPSGGGGGGVGTSGFFPAVPVQISVALSGKAFVSTPVVLLKDGQIFVTKKSNASANFTISLDNLSAGAYNFTLYGEDKDGLRSASLSFPFYFTAATSVSISNIFISPTISTDKLAVKSGEDITIFGQTYPLSEITAFVISGEEEIVKEIKVKADKDGVYAYQLNSGVLQPGSYSVKAKARAQDGSVSGFSKIAEFKVDTESILRGAERKCPAKADLNGNCKVNLVDFSIAAYWWNRVLSQEFISKEKAVLSGDGKLDLIDFSIMAYYWTG